TTVEPADIGIVPSSQTITSSSLRKALIACSTNGRMTSGLVMRRDATLARSCPASPPPRRPAQGSRLAWPILNQRFGVLGGALDSQAIRRARRCLFPGDGGGFWCAGTEPRAAGAPARQDPHPESDRGAEAQPQ